MLYLRNTATIFAFKASVTINDYFVSVLRRQETAKIYYLGVML